MDDALAEKIRQEELTSEFNRRYAEAIAIRFRDWHIAATIVLGIFGASSVLAFFAKAASPTVSVVLSSIVSLVSTVVLPALRWQKIQGEALAERKAWSNLNAEFELLASSSSTATEKEKDFARLRKAMSKQEGNGILLPRHKKLLAKIQRDVDVFHNLIGG
jgi:hypothetical protein